MEMAELLPLKAYLYAYTKLNPTALRKAKIVYNFGLSECNRVERKGKWIGNKKKHCAVDKNL